jgi:nucleotide-binding universal stress UspA family protein
MFYRIVVPLDGTDFAEGALAPASELARLFGSRLLLVRALTPPTRLSPAERADRQVQTERLNDADAYLHDKVAQLQVQGYKADLLVAVAEADASIARAAELEQADLIVMAAHLYAAAEHMDGRSTTLHLLDRSGVPVLVWHPGQAAGRVTLVRVDAPILVPLDGSALAEKALAPAEGLARAFGSWLVLVSAAPTGPELSSGEEQVALGEGDIATARRLGIAYAQDTAQRIMATREYLERLRAGLEERGVRAEVVVRPGVPFEVIRDVWGETGAGLIVMATHSHAWFMGRLLSSVAARVVQVIKAPALVLRPEGARLRADISATVSG